MQFQYHIYIPKKLGSTAGVQFELPYLPFYVLHVFFISNHVENLYISLTDARYHLKFSVGMFFAARKQIVMPACQHFENLTPFVTLLTLILPQNHPRFTKNTIKLDIMIVLTSNLVWVCFLGRDNRLWWQKFETFKSWPLLWRHWAVILHKISYNSWQYLHINPI